MIIFKLNLIYTWDLEFLKKSQLTCSPNRRIRTNSIKSHHILNRNKKTPQDSDSDQNKGPRSAQQSARQGAGSRFNPIENFPHLHRPGVLNPKSPSLTRRNSAIGGNTACFGLSLGHPQTLGSFLVLPDGRVLL
jgi:hypothetical protein